MRTYGRGGMRFNDPTDALSMLKKRYDNGGQVNGNPQSQTGGDYAAIELSSMSPQLIDTYRTFQGVLENAGADQFGRINSKNQADFFLNVQDLIGEDTMRSLVGDKLYDDYVNVVLNKDGGKTVGYQKQSGADYVASNFFPRLFSGLAQSTDNPAARFALDLAMKQGITTQGNELLQPNPNTANFLNQR